MPSPASRTACDSMAMCCQPPPTQPLQETAGGLVFAESLPVDIGSLLRVQTNAIQELSATALQLQQACAKISENSKGTSAPNIQGAIIDKRPASQERLGAIDVQVLMIVERIFDLDTINQMFGAQIMVQLHWKCPDSEEPPSPHEDDGDWTPEWVPKFRVRSLMEEIHREENFSTVDLNGEVWIKGSILMLVKIAEPLELTSFPNDCQDLSIILESKMNEEQVNWIPPVDWNKTTRDLTKHLPPVKLHAHRCQLNDFKLIQEIPFTYDMYVVEVDQKRVPGIAMTIKVVRKSFYYVLNVGVIVFGIISFVFCAWGLHPCDIEARHGLDFNLILTAVAFKLVLTGLLPAVSYVTRLDVYLLVAFLFLLAITVCHTVLPFFHLGKMDMSPLSLEPVIFPADQEEELIDRDSFAMFMFAGLWIAWNIGYCTYVNIKANSEFAAFIQEAKEAQKNYDESSKEIKKSASTVMPELS